MEQCQQAGHLHHWLQLSQLGSSRSDVHMTAGSGHDQYGFLGSLLHSWLMLVLYAHHNRVSSPVLKAAGG